ncbi:hypothetical protein [Clostridium tagluense]|uniref:Uncharacterized protein n=1 Tax=Clostridium tagluense TaxID=360422 RepID=A0A401UTM9_9CLOT|nr:hypothetical protein [Clostridium tagluense]GCD12905.1 hypothetical protein Ctaglu_45280 [Clostridium tagluense]
MKIKLTVKSVNTGNTFDESYTINNDINPQVYAQNMIDNYNRTLRPNESARELIDVEILDKCIEIKSEQPLKEFYGSVSFAGRMTFTVKATSKEEAKKLVFEDIDCLNIDLVADTTLEVQDTEWGLIAEARQGNVSQPYINDFEIKEEKEL